MTAGADAADPRVRRLVAVAVGCWAGAATALHWQLRPGGVALAGCAAGATALAGGVVWWQRRVGGSAVVGWALLAAVVAAGDAGRHLQRLRDSPLTTLAAARMPVTLTLRVVRDPATATTASGTRLWLVDATALVARTASGVVSVNRPVLVLAYAAGWAGLSPGQVVSAAGRLAPPRPDDTVSAVIDATGDPRTIRAPPWWQRLAGRVRGALAAACARLPAPLPSLIPALVLGVVTPLPEALRAQFRVTGLSHLVAVSGENLAILFLATTWLLRQIGLSRGWRAVALLATLVGFVVVARPSASVLRAAVMGGVAVLALATGRRSRPVPALALAVTALILVNPFLVTDVGFALSVAATAGIVVLAGPLARRWRRLPARVAALLAASVAAQAACFPLLVWRFGALTPYAVPANLIAGLAVAPATLCGVVVAVVALLSPPLAGTLAWLTLPWGWTIVACARWFAALPGAAAQAPAWVADVGLALLLSIGWRIVRTGAAAHEAVGAGGRPVRP